MIFTTYTEITFVCSNTTGWWYESTKPPTWADAMLLIRERAIAKGLRLLDWEEIAAVSTRVPVEVK